ncbi:MAG TPA: hypothetical protein VFX50_02760, partial [Gemmatimonadales bacterium]|nr:hypothetical protein [Gemmatimonadales bacterium]
CAVALPLAVLLLAACAAPDTARERQLTDATTAPLGDLHLVSAEIPEVLLAALKDPYRVPADTSCAALTTAVAALNGVLGPDLDNRATPANPGLVERGITAVGDAAIGAVRGATEGLIPYRRWVRKLSGAEKYSQQVAASIAAGTIRRAYLKGLGQAGGCPAPAAPAR